MLVAGTAAQQTEPQRPTFRSGVQLIEVDARVFDKNGRFVADLSKDDFEINENGVPQRIDAMYLVDGGAQAGLAATATQPSRADGQPLPVAPQTWIFFFDLDHLAPGTGFERAKKAVEDFIAQRFKDGDVAGILAGEKMVGNRLTSVRRELLDALKEVKPRSDRRTLMNELTREWPRFLDEEEAIRVSRNERDVIGRVMSRACAEDPDFCRMGDPEPQVRSKGMRFQQEIHRASTQTLRSLNGLASGLSKIPGPKTVVVLSDGFVVQDIETTLRSVVGQIARAGARIYAIDVRGLGRVGNSGIVDQEQADTPYNAVTRFDALADGTSSLAIDTGGLMIRNENNLGRALDRVADDAGRYYVLAYQPANANFDGKYRPIQVRVKREGLRVRARKGYLALEPSRMTLPQPIKKTPEPNAATDPLTPPDREAARPAAGLPVGNSVVGSLLTGAPDTDTAPNMVRMRPDAELHVRELSSAEPAGESSLADAGWAAYQRGDLEAAIGPLSAAAAQSGARTWVLYALGLTQAGLGRARDAITTWERLLATAPESRVVYDDLAATYASLSDLTNALTILRSAEQRWPRDPDVHNAIGVIHFRRGALNEAIDAFMKAIAVAPENSLTHLNLGRAYELRFTRSGRYVTSQRRWVVDESDRRKAREHYQACIRSGGPYVNAASDALSRLEWSK